jgi:hypothetical protein
MTRRDEELYHEYVLITEALQMIEKSYICSKVGKLTEKGETYKDVIKSLGKILNYNCDETNAIDARKVI